MRKFLVLPLPIAFLVTLTALAGAAGVSTLVNTGSPTAPFSENKQNEPSVAIDANHTNVLASGANDNIDMEACNAGSDTTCPFTNGVGVSGIYFSFDSGKTWTQPTYDGLTARGCQGVPGSSDPACAPVDRPMRTLPSDSENGLGPECGPGLGVRP